jgi:hypothetical protein
MSAASRSADIRGSDLTIAAILTTVVFGGSLFALAHARLAHTAELPSIDPGMGVPIAVRPVADFSSGGAGKAKADDQRPVVPRAWRRKVPRARAQTPPPDVQPDTPPPTEPLEHESAIAPDEPAPIEPSPTTETGEVAVEDSSADVEAQEQDEAGTEEEGEGEGGSEDEGETEGEAETGGEVEGGGTGTDPLLERAIAFYRARLVAWFSSRFRVTGSGLSPAQLAKYRVRVHIELGDDLRIVDYEILSADHPDFEKAARAMLEKMRGEKLPAPPENYPGAVQQQLTVTFTCAEDTCD